MNGPMVAAGSPQFMVDQRPAFDNQVRKRRKRKKKKGKK
jgi:hypothetical protein